MPRGIKAALLVTPALLFIKMLTRKEREFLLLCARNAITSYPARCSLDSESVSPALKEKKGVFVSIHLNDELRGCIGLLLPVKPLYEAVMENAVNAAYGDSRFPPLEKEELEKISIEISVLSDPVMLGYIDEAHLLKKLNFDEGVIIKKGFFKATFLPQVWEQIPDKKEFLGHLCLKANLEEHAWKDSESEVYAYWVESFSGYS